MSTSFAARCAAAVFLILKLFSVPSWSETITALKILEKAAEETFRDSFRVAVEIRTVKGGKSVSEHSLWMLGRRRPDGTAVVVDFDSPVDAKGLRFLFLINPDKERQAFMYFPDTSRTLSLAVEDEGTDFAGTGLKVQDILAMLPQPAKDLELIKEEKVEGRDCYMIKAPLPDKGGQRLLWVTKKGFHLLKSQDLNAKGKVVKTFKVIEFFTTSDGREFPRETEVSLPAKGVRVNVRHESAYFGIEIPEDLVRPESFGACKWRS
jgi:hypothetical protein